MASHVHKLRMGKSMERNANKPHTQRGVRDSFLEEVTWALDLEGCIGVILFFKKNEMCTNRERRGVGGA